jgi:hypothetical protein
MESRRCAFAILIERSHEPVDRIQRPNPKFGQDKSARERVTAAACASDTQAGLS